MIKPSPQFPRRAAAAMMPRRVNVDGVTIEPFCIARVAALYSVGSPLLYADPAPGLGVGWLETAYVMSAADPLDIVDAIASRGPGEIARRAAAAFEGRDFGFVARCAEAIKAEWARVNDLDPPDGAEGGTAGDPALGNSSGPATAG